MVGKQVNWGINTLTIELEAPAPLPKDTIITLSGLDTPVSSRDGLPLLGPSRDVFYYSDDNCPVENGVPISCRSTVNWDVGSQKLTLIPKREIAKGERIVVSFQFRNVGCDADFGCPGRTIMISATGPDAQKFLKFEEEPMDGQVMGAGVRFVSWIRKTVSQDHMVKSAPNKITFTFRPNTPLYEGTQIIIEGIRGSRTTTCKQCRPPNLIDGMGCDVDCQVCAPEEIEGGGGRTFRPCIPVYARSANPLSKHSKFEMNSGWYYDTGRLTLTVALGEMIPHDEDTQVVIIIQNDIIDPVPDTFRADCVPGSMKHVLSKERVFLVLQIALVCEKFSTQACLDVPRSADHCCITGNTEQDLRSPSACMTITLAAMALCNPSGLYGDGCDEQGRTVPDPMSMQLSSKAVDAFGKALIDTNPVAVRITDLYQLQKTIEAIPELFLEDTAAVVDSLVGVPTLRDGVLAAGSYSLFINLTNWLNNSARKSIVIYKEHPAPGKGKGVLGNENPKPRLMIEGPAYRNIHRGDPLSLNAVGHPIACHVQQASSLSYEWSMLCDGGGYGYCKLPPRDDIESIVQDRKVSDIVVRPDSMVPGAQYTFVCVVYQDFIPSRTTVVIDVAIRPLVVKIEGANAGGFVRADQDITLTAEDSYDPEHFMTGQDSNDFHYSWGCKQLRVKCTAPPELCPPKEFIDCPYEWFYRSTATEPVGHSITTNSSSFQPDWIYQIVVNVTRDGGKLIDQNRDIEDQIFALLPEEEEEEEEVEKVWFYEDLLVDQRWLRKTTRMLQFNTLPSAGKRRVKNQSACFRISDSFALKFLQVCPSVSRLPCVIPFSSAQ